MAGRKVLTAKEVGMEEIAPCVGAPPIVFEMTPVEVSRVAGEPKYFGPFGKKCERGTYDGFNVVYENGRVVEVEFAAHSRIRVNGISVFEEADGWKRVVASDGDPKIAGDVIVLLRLSIALVGFHDAAGEEDRAVGVFKPGRWSPERRKLETYVLE